MPVSLLGFNSLPVIGKFLGCEVLPSRCQPNRHPGKPHVEDVFFTQLHLSRLWSAAVSLSAGNILFPLNSFHDDQQLCRGVNLLPSHGH